MGDEIMEDKLNFTVEMITECFRRGNRLLVCGNGGSAADSAHITGEFVKGFLKKRPLPMELQEKIGFEWAGKLQQGLCCIDLTANPGAISATANDISGESVYAQEVLAYGGEGDIIIGISTSGNAENVCRALIVAKALGMKTIGMTGATGGRMASLCDILLNVPETETYKVQELHLPLYHQICARVEATLFEK